MAIKFEIMTNKWLYTLLAVSVLLVLPVSVWAYNSNMLIGNPSVMGHSAGEIDVKNSAGATVNLQINSDALATDIQTLQADIQTLQNDLAALLADNTTVDIHEVSGTSISGLIPNKKYLVHVYGITTNKGNNVVTLNPIGVKDCVGGTLSQTPSIFINWHDGQAPQSASFIIDAPASGCISGFADGPVLYMNAVSLN